MSANTRFSKTQLSKTMHSGEVICDIPSFGFILFNLATKGIYLGKYFLGRQTDKLNKKIYNRQMLRIKANKQ